MVYGDFNARSREWGDHHTNSWGKKLFDFISNGELTLCSPFDLTFSCNNGGSVIDLLLVDGPVIKDIGHQWVEKECELFTGAPIRGHYPVLHSLDSTKSLPRVTIKCTDWKKADWKKWNEAVEANVWGLQLIPGIMQDGKKLWAEFLKVIQAANKDHIPQKTISIHSKPYWTKNLSYHLQQVLLTRNNYHKRCTPNNKSKFTEAKQLFSQELIAEKNAWVKKRVENINVKDTTSFWKKYKRVFGAKPDNYIGNLHSTESCLATTDDQKEKILHKTFFTGKHLSQLMKDPVHEELIDEQYQSAMESFYQQSNVTHNEELNGAVSKEEVTAVIRSLKVNGKSCDNDNIHPCIIKNLGVSAITTLTDLFNWCLQTGTWIWTTSKVSFIRKEGKSSYTRPDSYRPISMASYFGKLLERILDVRLRSFYDLDTGSIDDDQEGFTSGRSTTRYLFRLIANLNEIKKKKLACIILFIDFQKAFDSVHLPTLMSKLYKLGVQGPILKLLHSFLFNRKVKLKVNNFVGASRICSLFGLPQGSVLSPFLFIVYVADMTDEIPPWLKKWLTCFKFADDGTFLVVHKSIFKCYRLMQRLCNELAKWCQKNKLVINCEANKTEAIVLKTNRELNDNEEPIPELKINGQVIKYVKNTKVLGVILDEDLNFRQHAEQKLLECKKKWGLITRGTNRNQGLNVRSLTLLWKTMIITKLMYAAPVWLWNNFSSFRGFWQSAIMKITGAMLNPRQPLVELALQIPPLEILTAIQTVKFLCKIISAEDNITSTLLQVEGSIPNRFHQQILSLKEFIQWKYPEKFGRRAFSVELSLVQQQNLSLHYTKDEINDYQTYKWVKSIRKQLDCSESTEINNELLKVVSSIETRSITLGKDLSLFSQNTTKSEDSHILDYLHGNSLLFGKCRKRMNIGDDLCDFCQQEGDSPHHQLFVCKEVQDSTYDNLTAVILNPRDYISEVLLPTKSNAQHQFIERVRFLPEQHDLLQSMKELDSAT